MGWPLRIDNMTPNLLREHTPKLSVETVDQLTELKAILKRTVSKQSEYIHDLKPNISNEYHCVQGINLSRKLKLVDYMPPLKMNITYPDAAS